MNRHEPKATVKSYITFTEVRTSDYIFVITVTEDVK